MRGLTAHNRKASILVLDNGAEFVPGLDADTGGVFVYAVLPIEIWFVR